MPNVNKNARFLTISPNNQSHFDIFRSALYHSDCSNRDGKTAYSAHHWHGACRYSNRSLRTEYPGARLQFRTLWKGRSALYHVSCWNRDGYGGTKEGLRQGDRLRIAHLFRTIHPHISLLRLVFGLSIACFTSLGMYHGE